MKGIRTSSKDWSTSITMDATSTLLSKIRITKMINSLPPAQLSSPIWRMFLAKLPTRILGLDSQEVSTLERILSSHLPGPRFMAFLSPQVMEITKILLRITSAASNLHLRSLKFSVAGSKKSLKTLSKFKAEQETDTLCILAAAQESSQLQRSNCQKKGQKSISKVMKDLKKTTTTVTTSLATDLWPTFIYPHILLIYWKHIG